MGDGANVFNTFSFNKWADGKREEEIDKESRRRRAEQIKRLKERLRKERALRSEGDGDLDLEALIEAIQRGQLIDNPNSQPELIKKEPPKPLPKFMPDELSDDYIFNEITMRINENQTEPKQEDVAKLSSDTISNPIEPAIAKPDPVSFKYNRRQESNEKPKKKEADVNRNFKYNRLLS